MGNGVWIGARSVILPGAMIGEGTVIGACSVVGKGVYDGYSIYAGIPARKRKNRGIDCIKDLNHKVLFR